MKSVAFILLLTVLIGSACQQRSAGQQANDQSTPVFAQPQEAARQAQRDLLVMLRLNPSLSVGLDSATVRQARPGQPVRQVLLDFGQLLRPGPARVLDSLVKVQQPLLVPLEVESRALTTVAISRQADGWSVAGIGNRKIASDLNLLRALTGNAEIVRYEVPNLHAQVYGVRQATGSVQYYTDYQGTSLREPISLDRLYSLLRREAQAFERTYGDRLRRERLVH